MGRQRVVNLLMNNLHGPPQRLEFAGAPVEELFQLGVGQGSLALAVGVLSHAGQLNLDVVADADVVPDAEAFTEGLREDMERLAACFRALPDDAWSVPAAHLEWTCRETVAHILDDLGAYALQLSGSQGPGERYVPLREGVEPRPGGARFLFWPEEDGGSADIVLCLDAVGGLLAAVVATAPPGRRRWHPYGAADASGWAAMGIAEAVLHGHDILSAHGVVYTPDGEIVGRVLERIFPHVERSARPWDDLLVATGRTDETRGRAWHWCSASPSRLPAG